MLFGLVCVTRYGGGTRDLDSRGLVNALNNAAAAAAAAAATVPELNK